MLGTFELIVIPAYLMGITMIGVFCFRVSKSMEDYLVGRRGMKWFHVALPIMAAGAISRNLDSKEVGPKTSKG